MKEPYHPFKSQKAKETYLAHYDKHAKRWPIASENKLVNTSFGQTFVRVSGPKDGPPLVLLPGDSENSLAWIPQIAALSVDYRTYALDHIFDNGRSIYTRLMKKPDDFVEWLDDLFNALELNSINLMGHSYGGWQASLYALAHPQRLEKLILLAPASTVLRPPLGLVVRAMLYYFIPIRFVTKRYLYWYTPDSVRKEESRETIDEMVEEQLLARRCFKRRKFVAPTVLTDQDWQRLQVPTYLYKEMIEMEEVRIILSGLWVALMLTYLLGDVLRIFAGDIKPGELQGGVKATQAMWFGIAIIMLVPIVMVVWKWV